MAQWLADRRGRAVIVYRVPYLRRIDEPAWTIAER
jgi:hypothetical protein